jgi:fructoselysine-6-P-deglycase FrlB-like protein
LCDEVIPANAPKLNDAEPAPYEIVSPQVLGYYPSLRSGLNPDNTSPAGIINRVAQGFMIHGASPADDAPAGS